MVNCLLHVLELMFSYIQQPLQRIRQINLPYFRTCHAPKLLDILFFNDPVLTAATTKEQLLVVMGRRPLSRFHFIKANDCAAQHSVIRIL